MARNPLACTNCDLQMDYDPGAAGNKCPKCGNGGLVAAESDMA